MNKIGLFYGTMSEHAEWIKHEAKSENLEVVLFNRPFESPEELNQYDGFLFMAYGHEKELMLSFTSISFAVHELEIPFIWAVDKKKNPLAYRSIHSFDELEDVTVFLTSLFEMANEFIGEKAKKKLDLRFPSIQKGNPSQELSEKEQIHPNHQEDEWTFEPLQELPDNNSTLFPTVEETDDLLSTFEPKSTVTPTNSEELIELEKRVPNSEFEEVNHDSISDSVKEDSFSIFTKQDYQEENMVPYKVMDEFEEEITITSLPNVIAVAGAGNGVGTSFIALNMAHALQGVLVEGKKTGTLAQWLGHEDIVDREAFLHGEEKGMYPVVATKELKSNTELNLLSTKARNIPFVVDCHMDSIVWRLAEHKVFVVTADPQYRSVTPPDDAKVILNRLPENFSIPISKIFEQTTPDLIVPDNGREVQLSLWGQQPYLQKQPSHVVQEWIDLIYSKALDLSDGSKEGELDWNLENHS